MFLLLKIFPFTSVQPQFLNDTNRRDIRNASFIHSFLVVRGVVDPFSIVHACFGAVGGNWNPEGNPHRHKEKMMCNSTQTVTRAPDQTGVHGAVT